VEFSARPLFDGVSFVINDNDKIALVGRNGAGKSTLLKILAGLQQPTAVVVGKPAELTVGYLPQQMSLADTRTVRDEAALAFSHVKELDREIECLGNEVASRDDYDSDDAYLLQLGEAAEAMVCTIVNRSRGEIIAIGGGEWPPMLKQAVMLLAGHWFNQREAVAGVQMHEVPNGVSALTKPYRVLVRDDCGTDA
jgi:ATPase subunit of ABC transporter with duplicated ATPase domains